MSGRTLVITLNGGRQGTVEFFRTENGNIDIKVAVAGNGGKRKSLSSVSVRSDGLLAAARYGEAVHFTDGTGLLKIETTDAGESLIFCVRVQNNNRFLASGMIISTPDMSDFRAFAEASQQSV
jgi:hypothetical protein